MTEAGVDIVLSEDNEKKFNQEDIRLGGSSPMITILKLSLGPIIFSIISSLQDAIDLMFIQKGFQNQGVTIVSISGTLKLLFLAVADLHNGATIIKISELIAKKKSEDTAQLFVDVIRYCIIMGFIFPPIMFFLTPNLLHVMGMPEGLISIARSYLFPANMCIFFQSALMTCCALIIAEGRATIAAIIQASVIISKIAMDPFMIFVLKAPIGAMGLADASICIIASVILLIIVFTGKFTTKPTLSLFKKKFSPHFWDLLKLCVPTIFQITIGIVVPMMVVAIITKAARNKGILTEVSTCYSATMKVYTMLVIIMLGSISGLAPSATYAYHKGNTKRMYQLAGCSMIIPIIIALTVCIIMVFFPKKVLNIWISGEILDLAPVIAPKLFLTPFLEPISAVMNQILIVFKRKLLAVIVPVVKATFLLSSAIILYLKNTDKPSNILLCYPIQDLSGLTISLIFFAYTYRKAESYLTVMNANEEPLIVEE